MIKWKLTSDNKYLGECIKESEYGIYLNNSNDYYIGHWVNDKRDGLGYAQYSDGRIYLGIFKDNYRVKGVTFTKDGNIIIDLPNTKLDLSIYKDGSISFGNKDGDVHLYDDGILEFKTYDDKCDVINKTTYQSKYYIGLPLKTNDLFKNINVGDLNLFKYVDGSCNDNKDYSFQLEYFSPGVGVICWNDGSEYVGQWELGKEDNIAYKNGLGIIKNSSDNSIEVTFFTKDNKNNIDIKFKDDTIDIFIKKNDDIISDYIFYDGKKLYCAPINNKFNLSGHGVIFSESLIDLVTFSGSKFIDATINKTFTFDGDPIDELKDELVDEELFDEMDEEDVDDEIEQFIDSLLNSRNSLISDFEYDKDFKYYGETKEYALGFYKDDDGLYLGEWKNKKICGLGFDIKNDSSFNIGRFKDEVFYQGLCFENKDYLKVILNSIDESKCLYLYLDGSIAYGNINNGLSIKIKNNKIKFISCKDSNIQKEVEVPFSLDEYSDNKININKKYKPKIDFETVKRFDGNKENSKFVSYIDTSTNKLNPRLGVTSFANHKLTIGEVNLNGDLNGLNAVSKDDVYYVNNYLNNVVNGLGIKFSSTSVLINLACNEANTGYLIESKSDKLVIKYLINNNLAHNILEIKNLSKINILDNDLNFIKSYQFDGVALFENTSYTPQIDIRKIKKEDYHKGDAEKILNSLIGLKEVKESILKIKAYAIKNKGSASYLHMAFIGNPGTGKTVVARLISHILHDAGVIKSSKCVECTAKDLIGSHIRETAEKTIEKIKEAYGGILFIDEAYGLTYKGGNDFGDECITELLAAMENDYDKLIIILAGYPKDIEKLIESNPGFKSRIRFNVNFLDYNKDELQEISKGMIEEKNYIIDLDTLNLTSSVIETFRCERNFANARTARNVIDDIILNQNVRTINELENRVITKEDVRKFMEDNFINLLSESSTSTAKEELDKLIGLESVKERIDELISYYVQNKDLVTDFHMMFTGNPGTGKTVCARLVARMLHERGILPLNKFYECSSTDLIGEYVGQTGPKTRKIIEKAMGGVLFIDEAYSLSGGKESNGANFGKEAIAELIKAMEDYRGKFCVILAGYTRPMNELFKVNEGLKSRVKFEINFPNYSLDELKEISKLMLNNLNYKMDEECIDILCKLIYANSNEASFANAREVRKALDLIIFKQASRVTKEGSNSRNIELCDLECYFTKELVDKVKFSSSDFTSSTLNLKNNAKMVNINRLYCDYATYVPTSFLNVKKDIIDSVVAITVETNGGCGEGSGFIFTADGYIGTCAHVVSGANKITVRYRLTVRNKNVDYNYEATLVAIDEKADIAVLKIDEECEFTYTPLATIGFKRVEPLQKIYLVGYPFGKSSFDNVSINEGRVASYQDNGDEIDSINVDIEAHRGNSGSCIVDEATGYIIGVLCGSTIKGDEKLTEEVNYCRPIKYLWELIEKNQ